MREEESLADVLGFGGGADGGGRGPTRGGGSSLSPDCCPSFTPSLELGVRRSGERGCVEAFGAEELAEKVEIAVGSCKEVSVALENGSETAKTLTDTTSDRKLQGGAARS